MTEPRFSLTHPIAYDAMRHRVWILGQRCHHGATGAVIAGSALVGVAVCRPRMREFAAIASAGTLLMAHDWKDRSMWFRPGPGALV